MDINEGIYFEACYDQNKKCILVDGSGQAEIKFTTDATQLASVLLSLAQFKDARIGITLKKLKPEGLKNGSLREGQKEAEVIR